MIVYAEKTGLADRLRAAGVEVAESTLGFHAIKNGEESAQVDAEAQAIIDAYTVSDAIGPIVMKVKVLAREKILAFLPDWKQSSCNARANELNEIRFSRELTADEQSELDAMRVLWGRAKAIRAASDVHEANLRAMSTFADVSAYDLTVGWAGQ